jgi:hypothetical protein
VGDFSQDGDFTVDLGESRRVGANAVSSDELDSNL